MTLTSQWHHILDNNSPAKIEFVGTYVVQFCCFWLPATIYTSLPYIAPSFSARHKIQKNEKQPKPSDIWECLLVVLRNQAISTTIHVLLISFHHKPAYRFDRALPSLIEIAWEVVLSTLIREVLFYYAHRAIHHPSLYPYVHKPHHRFTAPVALAAQYATVTEHLLANVLPMVLAPQLIGAHIVSFWVFLGVWLAETSLAHSGYDFLEGLAKKHDMHHEKFNLNYGTMGLMDWVHGTNMLRNVK